MRIVHVVTQLEVGGAQSAALRLAEGLRSRGHEVETWFLYRKHDCYRERDHKRVLLERRPRTAVGAMDLVRRMTGLLRGRRPDGVIGFLHYANILALLAARRAEVRARIASHHNPAWTFPAAARLADRWLGGTDAYGRIVAVSQSVAQSFAEYPQAYRRKLAVIPNGLTPLAPCSSRAETRRRYDLSEDAPVLLCVGRLVVQKNHEAALRAAALLPKTRLVLAGDGELRPALEALSRELGVVDRVKFLGDVPEQEVADLLHAADVFLMPSVHEGMSIALIEAMAAGMAVVASDIPSQADVLTGGVVDQGGLLVSPYDIRGMADAATRLLDDVALRSRLSAAARRRAAGFSEDAMVSRYEDCLLELSGRAGRTARGAASASVQASASRAAAVEGGVSAPGEAGPGGHPGAESYLDCEPRRPLPGLQRSVGVETVASPAVAPRVTRAVILGAASATTLCPLTAIRPSYLWPLANRPKLMHLLRALTAWGVRSVVVCCSRGLDRQEAERLRRAAAALGVALEWVVESEPSGTGGALRALGPVPDDEHVVVVSGTVSPSQLQASLFLDVAGEANAAVTLLARFQLSGAVDQLRIGDDGRILKAVIRDLGQPSTACWTSDGMWLLSAEALRRIPDSGFYSIREQLIPTLVDEGVPVYAVRSAANGAEQDGVARYLREDHEAVEQPGGPGGGYRQIQPSVWASPGAAIGGGVRFSGSVVIGAGSEVGDGARIVGPVSIGDGCTVAQRATVVRSVLWNGVHVAGGAVVRDAVLTDEAAVPESVRISDALVVNSSARSDCCKRLRRVAQAGPPVLMGRDGRLAPLGVQPAGARVEAAIRRLMDVVFAAGVLLVAMPVVALSAIAIKLDSKGPVLFRQYRCGRGGRVFPMLKLRTMVPDAPRRRAQLLNANEVDGPMFKMRGDPRITRVGRILRAASIDELPQMVNVLLGHMSLVGPRPLAPHEMALAPAWRDLRLTVKPGVTGLWQVRGRGIPRFADWISYDVYYVTHQSLLLDLSILISTPLTVLRKIAGK